MRIIGAIIFIAGFIFFIGNISGTFRTFPGLGYLTMLGGGYHFKQGGSSDA